MFKPFGRVLHALAAARVTRSSIWLRDVMCWAEEGIMKARYASALVLVLALSMPAVALTGDDLLEQCEGDAGHEMFCLGFIFGVGEHIGGC
jgi:hypothetical protein